jgi:mycofactocin system glycosyltransferase
VTRWPERFGLTLDRSVRTFSRGTVLVGGHPGRMITLGPAGVAELAALLDGGARSPAGGRLARRLVGAGMAHPRPLDDRSGRRPRPTVTVVVPVRDRSQSLDHCLAALGSTVPVIVVDDASLRPEVVAGVCRQHGARLIRRDVNGGPGAARNEALAEVESDLVAFVDSDCTVGPSWLEGLAWHFDDPEVAAVAPRVRPGSPGPAGAAGVGPAGGVGAVGTAGGRLAALDRYSAARSALDMGPDPAEVGPDRSVRYLPAAALVVRRSAVGDGFADGLRVGEDVDLVWRLVEGGHRVRYEPSVEVFHREPASWTGLLARRFRYGTSAAPLARRHPGRLAPLELRPGPTLAAVALLAGRPGWTLLALGASTAGLAGQVRGRGIPAVSALKWSAVGAGWTLLGLGRAASMLAGPGLVAVALRKRRARSAVAALVLLPPLAEGWRRRPELDMARWTVACVVDDAAYGTGVWAGCLRQGTLGPLVPAVRFPTRRARATPVTSPTAAEM